MMSLPFLTHLDLLMQELMPRRRPAWLNNKLEVAPTTLHGTQAIIITMPTPPARCCFIMGNVMSPGVGVMMASQIERASGSFLHFMPEASDRQYHQKILVLRHKCSNQDSVS